MPQKHGNIMGDTFGNSEPINSGKASETNVQPSTNATGGDAELTLVHTQQEISAGFPPGSSRASSMNQQSLTPALRGGASEVSPIDQKQRKENKLLLRNQELQGEVLKIRKENEALRTQSARSDADLAGLRERYSSLYSQLRVDEMYEPKILVQQFDNINKEVENLCENIAVGTVKQFKGQLRSLDPTTLDAINLENLSKLAGDKLTRSPTGRGRNIVDFLEVYLRHRLNETLTRYIFDPFHPLLPQDRFLDKLYDSIRMKEDQLTASRWRTSTFLASQELQERSSEKLTILLTEHFQSRKIHPVLTCIYGSEISFTEFLESYRTGLTGVFTKAYEWKERVSTCSFTADYSSSFSADAFSHDEEAFELVRAQPRADGNVQSEPVIPVTMGLMQSIAVGNQCSPKVKVALKMKIVSEGFF